MNVCMITLGCPKNIVDSETLLGHFQIDTSFKVVESANEADVIIINTCAFLLSAREEAIDTILQAAELKKTGQCKYVFVVGCLPQKYKKELEVEIPEVDGFFDQLDFGLVAKAIASKLNTNISNEFHRRLSTPSHYAYLKIADGCDNRCSYCTIPSIKGGFHSRNMQQLIAEANGLVIGGVKELVLIAQDTTNYGTDLHPQTSLYNLMSELITLPSLEWLRLMYTHPLNWDERLIALVRDSRSVCRYLEMPIQHASDSILKRMGRRVTNYSMRTLFDSLRNQVPNITLRTTAIVGFPGETRQDFETLVEFVNAVEFERLGIFTYSPEDDTPAFQFEDQIDDEEKEDRFQELLEVQKSIAERYHKQRIGGIERVIIDEYDDERSCYLARSEGESPDVDPQILIDEPVNIGEFYTVRITDADAYELFGSLEHIESQGD
ncbi:30S ribosomal protein S12 methylthiotransferase RimO [candidate division KSB1 bacterium]|nr:30S ribosomal protein S12 methylthiotransferase RimO [candidate division KSB1 bacterium]